MMRFDKLTIKAQEALQSAHAIAQKLHHQQVDCEHVLSALIQQPDGLVRPLLEKLGANPDAILAKLDDELNRRHQVTGIDSSEMYLDKPMRNHTLMQTIARANRVFAERTTV